MVRLPAMVEFVSDDLPYQIRLDINLFYKLVSECGQHQMFQRRGGRNHLHHIEMKLMCSLH